MSKTKRYLMQLSENMGYYGEINYEVLKKAKEIQKKNIDLKQCESK